jgi:hypothetical protein
MPVLTGRSSTIFIATEDGTHVYRGMGEVPVSLRRKLVQSTHGMNSATILIADKRGREELVRALRGGPSDVQCRLVDTLRARQNMTEEAIPQPSAVSSVRNWLEFLLPLMVGASLWLLTGPHF